jgi:hypothetical protein
MLVGLSNMGVLPLRIMYILLENKSAFADMKEAML